MNASLGGLCVHCSTDRYCMRNQHRESDDVEQQHLEHVGVHNHFE